MLVSFIITATIAEKVYNSVLVDIKSGSIVSKPYNVVANFKLQDRLTPALFYSVRF